VGPRGGYDAPARDAAAGELRNAQAVQVVAGHATDLEDCVELLAMLGLDAQAVRPAAPDPRVTLIRPV
jgi:hypothetical protein